MPAGEPRTLTLFRDCEIDAWVIPCHPTDNDVPVTQISQPQAHRLGPLLTVGYVDGDAPSFRQAYVPERSSAEACTKISLPP
jgi:hypothetical protein